jgi:hypothetical protein
MQVLVMFSQYRAFVYAQSLKYKLRLYLKEIMYFSPDTNVFGDYGCLKKNATKWRTQRRRKPCVRRPFA